jgi:carbon monoxide dehydrogenase subunit G
MPGGAAAAWAVLSEIESVAGCMPGAKITEKLGDSRYKGTVAVKFGPANMAFRGEVEVKVLDAQTRTLQLVGKGTDSTGTSGAAMDLTAKVEAIDDAHCNLVGHSEVSMSGKAATFGGRMAGAVADQVLKQFAANFAARVQAAQAAADAPPPQVTEAAPQAAAGEPVPVDPAGAATASMTATATATVNATSTATASVSAPASPALQAPAAPTVVARQPPLAAPAAPAEPAALNGLALAWAVFKDWFASLFSAGKKA